MENIANQCHKCSTLSNAETLTFSNKVYFDQYTQESLIKAINSSYSFRDDIGESYCILWICPICQAFNINLNGKIMCETIIPSGKNIEEFKWFKNIENLELKNLFLEFLKTIALKLNSSAMMLGRKILMHLAIEETGCEENKTFVYYVEEIEKSGILGNKWKEKIDQVRKLGNDENHKLKVATSEEVKVIEEIIMGVFDNIYI